MRNTLLLLPWLAAFGSCSAPPKPPTVDEAARRPVNSAVAVDLQTCRHDLQGVRTLTLELERQAQSALAAGRQLDARERVLTALTRAPQPAQPANLIFTIPFAFNSTDVILSLEVERALVAAATSAQLVVLRGRTDGSSDAVAESRVARSRAEAVRQHLVSAGVAPSRIRTTYQPSGDHIADNTTQAGQRLNRRVEVELYQQLPEPWPSARLGSRETN